MKKKAYFSITNFLLLLLLVNSSAVLTAQSDISISNESEINTAFQEYSPAFYKNGLVFIGSNPAVVEEKKTDDETGKKATSFFLAMRGDNGNLKKVVPFAEELTTKFYDGPLSFNADGSIVYFTRSNLRRGKALKAKDGLVKLKIYSAEKTDKGWDNITDLALNLPDYDCTHPSISPDGKRLYFASNRPDGFGGMDLYVCTLLNGKWSIPVNCGPKVNTAKSEIFPFIHADGTLYFTSNGRGGLGNLDIFYTMKTDTGWLAPRALPEPLNSASDDFGLIVSNDKQSGYFSSNRASGKGDDDIYSFIAPNNINEAVLAITETPMLTQLEQTEAPATIINRATPPSDLMATIAPTPLKNASHASPNKQVEANLQLQVSTPNVTNENVKIDKINEINESDKTEKPVGRTSQAQKLTPVLVTSPTQSDDKQLEKKDKPSDVSAVSEKLEPFSEAENLSNPKTSQGILTALPSLKPLTLVSIETYKMPKLKNIVPVSLNKIEKENEKPIVIADNKPLIPPLDAPKQDLKTLEKPAVEATRSEFVFEEPTHTFPKVEQVKENVRLKEEVKEVVKELVKEETLTKDNASLVEKEDNPKMSNSETFTAEVHENKTLKKEDIKLEKEGNTVIDLKKSEANGTVRKKYLVVVGTYSDRHNAVIQQKKATTKGYNDAEIVQYATNHLFGVCVLQSDDEKIAQALARDINKSKAMEAFVKVLK